MTPYSSSDVIVIGEFPRAILTNFLDGSQKRLRTLLGLSNPRAQ